MPTKSTLFPILAQLVLSIAASSLILPAQAAEPFAKMRIRALPECTIGNVRCTDCFYITWQPAGSGPFWERGKRSHQSKNSEGRPYVKDMQAQLKQRFGDLMNPKFKINAGWRFLNALHKAADPQKVMSLLQLDQNRAYAKLEKSGNTTTISIYLNKGVVVTGRGEPFARLPAKIQTGKNYALLIAVQNYDDPGFTDLREPINDLHKLKKTLTSRYTFEPDNIKTLEDPARADVFRALDELKTQVGKDDQLLVFFAGHGLYDKDSRQGYWQPRDALADSRVNSISNSTIRDHLRALKSKHILLISDACFSGAIFTSRSGPVDAGLHEINQKPSRRAITSGAKNEPVPDKSIFLDYLIKNLNENHEEALTSSKLFAKIQDAVPRNGGRVPQQGYIQNTGDEGGDFLFFLKE